MTNDITAPKNPEDDGPVNMKSPLSLLRLAVGTLLYTTFSCGLAMFNGIVDWTKSPDMTTVHTVVHQLKVAALLGSIKGFLTALMVVTIVLVGPPFWAVIGPVVTGFASGSLRFAGAFARALRSKGPFDPKDPFGMHSGENTDGSSKGGTAA